MNNALKHIRKLRGMVLVEVAARYEELTGKSINSSTISHWENGTAKISADDALILAEIYHCSLDVLMGRTFTEESSLKSLFYSMPENEQEIARYAFAEWHGDIHTLLNYIGAYVSLPPEVRGDVALYQITRYCETKEKSHLQVELPVDDNLLKSGLDNLIRKG